MLFRREQALRVAQLARLRFLVAQAEREREPTRKRAATKVEHARALHPTVADQRHICRAAADVDEDAPLGPDLLVGARAGQRVWLGDSGRKLEVELPHHRLDG